MASVRLAVATVTDDADPARPGKRLQRAREAIEAFTRSHCGLVSDAAPCACNQRVPVAIRLGRVRRDELHFAEAGISFGEVQAFVRGIEEAKRVLELQRGTSPRCASSDFTRRVVSALEAPNTEGPLAAREQLAGRLRG